MKKISIIIPFLNEGDEPLNTIKNIYQTADSSKFEIILLDDNSTDDVDPSVYEKFKEVTYIRNSARLGVDGCRQYGGEIANGEFIFILDAHMRFFNDGWIDKLIDVLESEKQSVVCMKSYVIDNDKKDEWDINKLPDNDPHHSGANILTLLDLDGGKIILDPRWRTVDKENEKEIQEIHCVMGACYGMSKQWFKHIRGFEGLKQWGTSEEFISLKSWLAGGKVLLMNNTGVGHIYRASRPAKFNIDTDWVLYNKLWMVYTLFPDDIIYKFFNFIMSDERYNISFKYLNENILEAKEAQRYYRDIFTKDISFLSELGINFNFDDLNDYSQQYEKFKQLKQKRQVIMETFKSYKDQLTNLDNNELINENKKIVIRNKLINKYLPEYKEKLENIQNELFKLEKKFNFNKSIFGYD